jgi:ribosome-associated protein
VPAATPAPDGKIAAMTTQMQESAEIARRVVDLLSDRQAEDVVLLDIHEVASFTDFFVIASAQNERHLRALVDAVNTDLAREEIKAIHVEGEPDSGWVLVDFGGVIAHLMAPEERAFYNIEGLWRRAGVSAVRFQ